MASSYNEDELDYEDEDYTQAGILHPDHVDMNVEEGEGEERKEEKEEEDYDDLYSDVNVGFFPPPPQAMDHDLHRGLQPNMEKTPEAQVQAYAEQTHAETSTYKGEIMATSELQQQEQLHNQELVEPITEQKQETAQMAMDADGRRIASSPNGKLSPLEGAICRVNEPSFANDTLHVAASSAPPDPMPVNKASSSPARYYTEQGSTQSGDGGHTRLLITGLEWWTTDAELEGALLEYGRVKNLKFLEERASGKSKGCCQIEFYDASAARACIEGMNGRIFNGRPCAVSYSSLYTYRQLNSAHDGNIQAPQTFNQGRKVATDFGSMRSGSNGPQGGKIGMANRSQAAGSGRMGQGNLPKGRGGLGSRSMGIGGASGYGQGSAGTMVGSAIPAHGMMTQGYDPTYGPAMGRGASGYGGYVPRGPAYAGIGLPYPMMHPGILPGVAPHINPAFFARGANMNGMGMLTGSGLEGAGGWPEASLSAWGNEEREQRTRESSYGEESGGSDMGYEKGRLGLAREKGRDGEWGSFGGRRHKEEREVDWEMENLKERERDWDHQDEDYERERHARPRNKPRSADDDQKKFRPREEDFGKRRRTLRSLGGKCTM